MPSPFDHPSGLAGAYDRSTNKPEMRAVVFREGVFAQGAEWNEAQSIVRERNQRTSNLVARDGDRIEGADIIVNVGAGTVQIAAGKIYLKGDVRPVIGATLTEVPMVGQVSVGLRLSSSLITEVEDPDLLGLGIGTPSEGEKGAGREIETVVWGREGDGGAGVLYQVYLLDNGVAIDQTPPPSLSGVNAAIAIYDRGAHGHYVVSGCEVSALGLSSGKQVFSIAAGEANINGFKRTRNYDLRYEETETPDVNEVEAEPRTFSTPATTVFTPYRLPVASVQSVTVEKEVTAAITRGGIAGTADTLPQGSVLTLVEVKQGGTTYTATTDYLLTAGKVDWAPGGTEPAPASTYTVKYRYLDTVPAGSGYTFTANSITVNGGVTGGQVFLNYSWKMPRIDLLCIDDTGLPVYVTGVSAVENPRKPVTPSQLLLLASITNNWSTKPAIENAGIRSIQFLEMWKYFNLLFDQQFLVGLERLQRGIDTREPVSKRGTFVDPFVSDFYRDQGVGQTAAIVDGSLQLAIDPTFYVINNLTTMLGYTDEFAIKQELSTTCIPINPYLNFDPLPGVLTITPATDFWVEYDELWLSNETRQIVARAGEGGTTQRTQTIDQSSQLLPLLRQIPIAYTISGFGAGEVLSTLTFDGVDVKPVGAPTASGSGVYSNTFNIPANVAAGTKLLEAVGAGGTKCSALFVGQGTLETTVFQRIITIARVPSPPATSMDFGAAGAGRQYADPQAQTFMLLEGRHASGFDIKFCTIGNANNRCLVELVVVRDGTPTAEVLAQASLDMTSVVVNAWTPARFNFPPYLAPGVEYAFVVKTNDAVHSLSMARLGDFDPVAQKFVGAQPYSIGVNADSSNGSSWSFNQNRDITFRGAVALFAPTTKTVVLGTFPVASASEFMVLGGVDLPTEAAQVTFELERATGEVIPLALGQWLSLTEYVTEAVKLRAVLKGSSKVSPTLFAGVTLVAGSIRASGTYVTRAMDLGTAVRFTNYYKAMLPAGASITVEYDKVDNNWLAFPLVSTTALNGGFVERKHNLASITATQVRIRATLAGGPAARPLINDFMALVV